MFGGYWPIDVDIGKFDDARRGRCVAFLVDAYGQKGFGRQRKVDLFGAFVFHLNESFLCGWADGCAAEFFAEVSEECLFFGDCLYLVDGLFVPGAFGDFLEPHETEIFLECPDEFAPGIHPASSQVISRFERESGSVCLVAVDFEVLCPSELLGLVYIFDPLPASLVEDGEGHCHSSFWPWFGDATHSAHGAWTFCPDAAAIDDLRGLSWEDGQNLCVDLIGLDGFEFVV